MPSRFPLYPLLTACIAFGATACGRQVYLGTLPDGGAGILWQATFEPGDLSEWLGDGSGGVYMDSRAQVPAVTQDMARRGQYAGVATIDPTSITSWSYLYREQPSPPEAYYGAWFYIPATLEIRSWLSLHHYGYRATANAETTPVWDFHVYPTAAGSLAARLYEASTSRNLEQQNPVPVSLATWVHFEIFLRKAADAAGHITVWQDGVQILDLANVVTAPTEWLQWDVGAASNDIAPTPAIVFFDDATISSVRVGIQP